MIPCGDRADVNGWRGGSGVGCPLIFTLGGRSRGRGGFIFKIPKNKQQTLGPKWSLFKVVTPTPHYLDIPH